MRSPVAALFLLVFTVCFLGCQPSVSMPEKSANTVALATDSASQNLHHLLSNSSQTYVSSFNSLKETAGYETAILFFDPHGDGWQPIHKYAALAERYGYLLIGSNYSSNDRAIDDNLQHAMMLIAEVKKKYGVKHLVLAGFSGGAKVALLTASRMDIEAVVYSGAVIDVPIKATTFLLGIAGQSDMNFPELVLFDRHLQSSNHAIRIWNGKHEWPDTAAMEPVFHFPYQSSMASSISTAQIKELQSEQSDHEQLAAAFLQRDLLWWRQTMEQLQRANNPKTIRELAFLSLAGFSFSNNAINDGQYDDARKFLTIYEWADPTNPDIEKLKVLLRERSGH
ncbi:MAG: hypothetical protein U0T73_13555 [Chitinophagales bacterium]